jgi:hypothetical protein
MKKGIEQVSRNCHPGVGGSENIAGINRKYDKE